MWEYNQTLILLLLCHVLFGRVDLILELWYHPIDCLWSDVGRNIWNDRRRWEIMSKVTTVWNYDAKKNSLTRLDAFLSTFAFSMTALISIHFLFIFWSCKSIIANMRLSFPSISVFSWANSSAYNVSLFNLHLAARSVTSEHCFSFSVCCTTNSLCSCLLVDFRFDIWSL